MKHLRYLKIVNFVYGGLLAFAAFALLAIAAGVGTGAFRGYPSPALQMTNTALIVATVVVAILALLAFWTGTLVARARGRLLQTVLALLNVLEFPIGTIYGVYALWVCWFNERTREAFSSSAPA